MTDGRSRRYASRVVPVHNLPSLLRDWHPELLDFHLDTERQSYKRSVDESEWQGFVYRWQRLDVWRASQTP